MWCTNIDTINLEDVAAYLRLDDLDCSDELMLTFCMDSARAFICDYTGIPDKELNQYPALTIPYMLICEDFWDVRSMNIPANKAARNKTAITALEMHRQNFL